MNKIICNNDKTAIYAFSLTSDPKQDTLLITNEFVFYNKHFNENARGSAII